MRQAGFTVEAKHDFIQDEFFLLFRRKQINAGI